MSTDTVRERYSRQMLFRPIGPTGQERLAQARVAIVGMGALGTILSTQVVRAGVGFVRLIDRDIIEPSNLQRQALYDEIDAEEGLPKAVAAKEKLQRANSGVEIEALATNLTWRNAESLLTDVDVILDGTDKLSNAVFNQRCRCETRDCISGATEVPSSSYGTTAFLRPGITECLVCLWVPNKAVVPTHVIRSV